MAQTRVNVFNSIENHRIEQKGQIYLFPFDIVHSHSSIHSSIWQLFLNFSFGYGFHIHTNLCSQQNTPISQALRHSHANSESGQQQQKKLLSAERKQLVDDVHCEYFPCGRQCARFVKSVLLIRIRLIRQW